MEQADRFSREIFRETKENKSSFTLNLKKKNKQKKCLSLLEAEAERCFTIIKSIKTPLCLFRFE